MTDYGTPEHRLRQIDGRAAALAASGVIAGYVLAVVQRAAGPASSDHVLLDFALASSVPGEWTRTDFTAPALDFVRRIRDGHLHFNGVDYELRWLNDEDTSFVIERYDLTTWDRSQS